MPIEEVKRTLELTDHQMRVLDVVLAKATKGRASFKLQDVPIDRSTLVELHQAIVAVLP